MVKAKNANWPPPSDSFSYGDILLSLSSLISNRIPFFHCWKDYVIDWEMRGERGVRTQPCIYSEHSCCHLVALCAYYRLEMFFIITEELTDVLISQVSDKLKYVAAFFIFSDSIRRLGLLFYLYSLSYALRSKGCLDIHTFINAVRVK